MFNVIHNSQYILTVSLKFSLLFCLVEMYLLENVVFTSMFDHFFCYWIRDRKAYLLEKKRDGGKKEVKPLIYIDQWVKRRNPDRIYFLYCRLFYLTN